MLSCPMSFKRCTVAITLVAFALMTTPATAQAEEWLPEPTVTVSSASELPVTLNNGDVLLIRNVAYSAPAGVSPITVAHGATATVIVEGNVTLHGADAVGRRGATPAIEVPEGATLVVYSAHDEELAASDGAPKDSLTVTGGAPAKGGDGQNALGTVYDKTMTSTFYPYSGAGGDGGGGGAAAIGGRGGDGGAGGKAKYCSQTRSGEQRMWSAYWKNGQLEHINGSDNDGTMGIDGEAGEAGETGGSCGTIYVLGRLNLSASASGENAAGGNGGSGDGGGNDRDTTSLSVTWELYGGPGGGGGGGGGLAAPAIGGGGAGGSGGGSGGTSCSDDGANTSLRRPYCCGGGGGGGGGWPNGGGGGGGGYIGTEMFSLDGLSWGAGGAAGGIERGEGAGNGYTACEGYRGTAIYYDGGGNGGSGGKGIDAEDSAAGGARVYTKETWIWEDDAYSGAGGDGGGPVQARSWPAEQNAQRSFVLSTAGNYAFSASSSLGYACGSGGGYGASSRVSVEPFIVYDLADLDIALQLPEGASYTYTGSAITPEATLGSTASYSAASDRDGALAFGASAQSLTLSDVGDPQYTSNVHCPEGTVTFTASNVVPYANLVAAIRNARQGSSLIVGSVGTGTFAITKATFTSVPIVSSVDTNAAQVDEPVGLSLSTYAFASGSGKLSELWLDAQGTVGAPTVTWSVVKGAGTFSTTSGLETTFTPTSTGEVQVRATLSGMNDFNDFETTLTFANVSDAAHVHSLSKFEAKDPTCTETGNVEHWQCAICGTLFSDADGAAETTRDAVTLVATGHATGVLRGTKEATCTEAGYTGDTVCPVCDEVLETGEPIPATGHGDTELRGAKEASCTAEGYTGDEVCTVCDAVVRQGEPIPVKDHDWSDGYAKEHADAERHYHVCTVCAAKDVGEVHEWNVEEATEDTDKHCVVCSYVAQEKLGHTHAGSFVAGTDATCTEAGSMGYYACDCGKAFEDEVCTKEISYLVDWRVVEPLGHDFANYVFNGDATCTSDGTETATCSRCDVTDTRTATGSAAGHGTTELRGAKAATYTEEGYTGDEVCTVCDAVVRAGETILKLTEDPGGEDLDPTDPTEPDPENPDPKDPADPQDPGNGGGSGGDDAGGGGERGDGSGSGAAGTNGGDGPAATAASDGDADSSKSDDATGGANSRNALAQTGDAFGVFGIVAAAIALLSGACACVACAARR